MLERIKHLFSKEEKQIVAEVASKPRKDHSLERYIDAQERMYDRALEEVKNGKKVTHWIWYIFPQIKGLGTSNKSIYYGIDSQEEAEAYLRHPILGARLREITSVFLNLNRVNAKDVFGELDAMKVRSCMTLFDEVADDNLFQKVIDRYFNGCKDISTLKLLGISDNTVSNQ